jgi:hypothetical protein
MRGLLTLGLMITLSCCKRDKELSNTQSDKESFINDIRFNTVDLDTLMLKRLVLTNDRLLGIFKIELQDKQKSERNNKIIKRDSNRLRVYNSSEFKIMEDKRCDSYRHLLISKNRNLVGIDLEPYQGLYFLIIDPNDKIIVTEKMEEKSLTMGITSTTDQTNWSLTKDSVLTINSQSTFCSDVVIEGHGMTCWTDNIQKQYKLSCDGLRLIKKDSARIESTE